MYRWPGEGEPVVLLHGMGGTSLQWAGYVDRLDDRLLCAVDTIGDVGRSEQLVPVESAADLARWLEAVLADLDLESVHLVGSSYGGFLGLNLAAHAPAHVRTLTLLEPVGLVPFRMAAFLGWGGAVLAASLLPDRPRRAAARRLGMPALEDKRIMRMALHAQVNHPSRLFPAGPVTAEELGAVTVPVLVLLGEKSPVHHPSEVRDRAMELLPDVRVEIVPDAGHALPLSHTDLVVDRLRAFLTSRQ